MTGACSADGKLGLEEIVENENGSLYNKGTSSIPEALDAIKRGEFVVVLDNEDRENEGDLIMPASFATPKALAFMIRYCSGVICCATTEARLRQLELPLMVSNNTEARKCKFTISIDYNEETSTGISASDRAKTIFALGDPNISKEKFNRPGHVFPLLATNGGVIQRAGHTEAAVDLARLTGCFPAGYLCEINNDEGVMMRRPELERFAAQHRLHMITISDLIRYRCVHEKLVVPQEDRIQWIHTPHGNFQMHSFTSIALTGKLVALVYGSIQDETYSNGSPLVYFVQTGLEGNVEGQWAQKYIAQTGNGILLSIEGQDELVNVSGELMAMQSIFGMGMQMLRHFGIHSIQLLSTNKPCIDTSGFGMQIINHITLNEKISTKFSSTTTTSNKENP